jgi:hypothetical protein
LIVCALCALVILKPQEFVPALAGMPLLYILFGAAIFVGLLFAALGRLRMSIAPHLPFAAAFLVWAAATTAIRRPTVIEKEGLELAVVLALCAVLGLFAGTSRGLKLFTLVFLGCALFVTAAALEQAEAPFQCMLAAPDDWEGKGELEPDGRFCEVAYDCRKDAPDPDANYRCERAGPFGTTTIGGRVRYRGSLADPNELSLTAVLAIPFALALVDRKKGKRERRAVPGLPLLVTDKLLGRVTTFVLWAPVMAAIAAIAWMVIVSQSRTGVLVFMFIVGVSFLRKVGPWGVVVGCVLFPPMLMLGGRSGAEAEASAEERTELLAEALQMIRQSKGIGVGVGQFGDESSLGLTAHNSYLLAAAETGLIGLCLFGLTLYLGLKVPLSIWLGDYQIDNTLTRLAPALAIAIGGAYLGIFFLSWSYKDILYIILGASAALYQAARAQDPSVRVGLSGREAALVCAGSLALLPMLYVFLHIRG